MLDKKTARKALRDMSELPKVMPTLKSSYRDRKLFVDLIEANLILGRFGPAIELVKNAEGSTAYKGACAEAWFKVAEYYEFHGNELAAIRYFTIARGHEGNKFIRDKSTKRLSDIFAS